MPENENILHQNSEEIQEIITAVPSWILRRGIMLIFMILLSIVFLSTFVSYPDIVKTSLKINSLNAPKAVHVKHTGKIVSLLVKEGTVVKQKDPLAFMESTADHRDVIKFYKALQEFNRRLSEGKSGADLMSADLNLGELQGTYQVFHQQYLQYIYTQNGGYYSTRRQYLQKDLKEIDKLRGQILAQKETKEMEYANIEQEYEAYKKLYKTGVISVNEFKQQENKYLAGKYPLQQTTTELISNAGMYSSKQKEIMDIDHTVEEEKAKFTQALNNMITETNAWLNQYILFAPVDGYVGYAGIIQENQTVTANQELLMINPANTDFFGELHIPQHNMGKIRKGQNTLIKMKSYPFEQYGMIRGKITYITDVAFRDSLFIAKVSFEKFENKDPDYKIVLKNGMLADAEIITEESSLLQRFARNITKLMNSGS